jgi:hypothetical protein
VLQQVALWLTIAFVISTAGPALRNKNQNNKNIKYNKLFLCFAKLRTDEASSYSKARQNIFDFGLDGMDDWVSNSKNPNIGLSDRIFQ